MQNLSKTMKKQSFVSTTWIRHLLRHDTCEFQILSPSPPLHQTLQSPHIPTPPPLTLLSPCPTTTWAWSPTRRKFCALYFVIVFCCACCCVMPVTNVYHLHTPHLPPHPTPPPPTAAVSWAVGVKIGNICDTLYLPPRVVGPGHVRSNGP